MTNETHHQRVSEFLKILISFLSLLLGLYIRYEMSSGTPVRSEIIQVYPRGNIQVEAVGTQKPGLKLSFEEITIIDPDSKNKKTIKSNPDENISIEIKGKTSHLKAGMYSSDKDKVLEVDNLARIESVEIKKEFYGKHTAQTKIEVKLSEEKISPNSELSDILKEIGDN